MSKKRRTKQQKIIASLRRQLNHTTHFQLPPSPAYEPIEKVVYESPKEQIITKKVRQETTVAFSYDPKLIKKDLIKTATLSTIFLGAIVLIQRLFHL